MVAQLTGLWPQYPKWSWAQILSRASHYTGLGHCYPQWYSMSLSWPMSHQLNLQCLALSTNWAALGAQSNGWYFFPFIVGLCLCFDVHELDGPKQPQECLTLWSTQSHALAASHTSVGVTMNYFVKCHYVPPRAPSYKHTLYIRVHVPQFSYMMYVHVHNYCLQINDNSWEVEALIVGALCDTSWNTMCRLRHWMTFAMSGVCKMNTVHIARCTCILHVAKRVSSCQDSYT